MHRPTIVWDFDGTLLPSDPYDSEQSLLRHLIGSSENKLPFGGRLLGNLALYADRRQWIPAFFRHVYLWLLNGTSASIIETVGGILAEKISEADKTVLFELKEQGYPMMVLSCGTADLSRTVIQMAGIASCFQNIEGNRFRIRENRIVGMQIRVPDPGHKIRLLTDEYGLTAREVVAIGDGYTDIPLLNWAGVSVLIERNGTKSFRTMRYHTVSRLAEIPDILELNDGGTP